MKLSLNGKISLWLVLTIIVAFLMYGALIYFVYKSNLRGPGYFESLEQHPGFDKGFIDRIKQLEEFDQNRKEMFPTAIIPPHIFVRVFSTITGGVLFIIIISATGGFIFLNRMLRQINFITKNVEEINYRKLHIRLNLKGKDPISNMAQTFDKMLDQIEQSFKTQKQFIQNASHEINTPLTIIKTKLDVLKQKKSQNIDEYKGTFNIIEGEVSRLSKITQDLLMLADIEENSSVNNFESVDMGHVLKKIAGLFDNRLIEKKLNIKISSAGNAIISADSYQIEQMIFNLLDNAVKYSNPDSIIEISLYKEPDKKNITLNISNSTLAKIDGQQMKFIFDRFYKIKTGDSFKNGGFGLGLSIVKKIVENHNGMIEARLDDTLNLISFIITLPTGQ
jgi:signal transduction histidine kinase